MIVRVFQKRHLYLVILYLSLACYFFNWLDLVQISPVVKYSTDRLVDIVSLPDFKFLIVPQKFPCHNRPTVIISVKSAMMEFQNRQIIRQTYGRIASDLNIPVVFFLGSNMEDTFYSNLVKAEADKYDDIVQADYSDTYRNVTMKSYSILRWQTTMCPEAKYYFNTDSDVIVFPENLSEFIKEMEIHENAITGYCKMDGSVVVRNMQSQWYVSPAIYPDDWYPPHCLGCGYIMTGDAPSKLLNIVENGLSTNSWNRWKDFPIDDVLFTGILVKEANITLYSNVLAFRMHKNFDLCNPKQHVVSVHGFHSPTYMKEQWLVYREQLKNCNHSSILNIFNNTDIVVETDDLNFTSSVIQSSITYTV